MKRKFRLFLNAILSMLLGWLGMSSCDSESNLCMYGVPSVELDVTGQVTDSVGNPLRGIEVAGPSLVGGLSVTSTDENGNFHLIVDGFEGVLFLTDLSTADGCYLPDTFRITEQTYLGEVDGWDGWRSRGEAHGLKIQMRESTLDEYRATYDIIGSWTEVTIVEDGGRVKWCPRSFSFAVDGSVECTTDTQTERGNYTYEYRVLRTDLNTDSLVSLGNYYRYRVWRKGEEMVMWTPSWMKFEDQSLSGYFYSCTPTEKGYVTEEFCPAGGGSYGAYLTRNYYEGNFIVKAELVEGRGRYVAKTDGSGGGTYILEGYNGQTVTIPIVSISQYGFAAGDKSPYKLYLRVE